MNYRNRIFSGIISLILMCLAGCATVTYDPQADQQLTTLTQDINSQLSNWAITSESTKKSIPFDPSFYSKVESQVATLEIRMEATQDPASVKIAGIFNDISDQIDKVRILHQKQNNLSSVFVRAQLRLINAQLAALTTYELSLKGAASGTGSTTSTATTTAQAKATAANATAIVSNAK
ncbi:hypothetical protein QN078_10440 [Ralstonia nicotianae]|uniref:hypothetical protein n=1 Tax=Ralstonia pseudosolanacearum TaxID=1310165 RepID=UPI000A6439F3|nr:hypothetical protein [Ralstonia pseudosolanacearum]MCK4133210.1 hypothetical protein [Ralstonia pseudosolanacearum]MDK1380778.1 hypothetical protein [Ralstonia pseudosolanacearum]